MSKLDPLTNAWEAVANMGEQRICASVAALNGSLYAVGGSDGTRGTVLLSSMERYDPDTNKWEAMANMGTERRFFGVVAM